MRNYEAWEEVTRVDMVARSSMSDMVDGIEELSDTDVEILEALTFATPRALMSLAAVSL